MHFVLVIIGTCRIYFLLFSKKSKQIKKEINGKYVSVIFDGTTRMGEALAVVLRFVDDEEWVLKQRLVHLQLLAKSLCGEEIARELISITVNYSIESNKLLAIMRDGASSNGIAVRTLQIVFPNAMDITCFSYTLDRVGKYFKIPILPKFYQLVDIHVFPQSQSTTLLVYSNW